MSDGTPPPAEPEATARESRTPAGVLPVGSVFAGRYRIVRRIANGGMGAVYEVVHIETERRRALKVMHPHIFQSEDMRSRFKREARIAAQVESEYIVDVSDAGVDEASETPFLVMEMLQGEELGDRLKRMGRLPPVEVVTYLHQMSLALDKTHAKFIVHRDLKPENVFLTVRDDGSPRVKILDFGVAKVVAEGATAAGATRALGTPIYMAPEQFRTGSKLVPAADIYALGMMTYTLLTGTPYWAGEARSSGDVIAFAMAVIKGPQDPASLRAAELGVALPPAFDAWFTRVTAVNPGDRFPTASQAVRALIEALGVAPGAGPVLFPAADAPAAGAAAPVTPAADGSPAQPVAPAAPVQGQSQPLEVGSGPQRVSKEPSVPFVSAVLEPATISTGAAGAAAPVERPRSRGALFAGLGVLVLAALGAGGWLALRSHDSAGPAPSVEAAHSATQRPEPIVTPASPAPVVPPSTTPTAAPEPPPSETPTSPTSTAKPSNSPSAKPTSALAVKPSATPAAKPTSAPTSKPSATPTAKPLIGRD